METILRIELERYVCWENGARIETPRKICYRIDRLTKVAKHIWLYGLRPTMNIDALIAWLRVVSVMHLYVVVL